MSRIDYAKRIIRHIANDDPNILGLFEQYAEEIDDEITWLRKQRELLNQLHAYLIDKDLDEAGEKTAVKLIPKLERSKRIKEAAEAVAKRGDMVVTAEMVGAYLEESRLSLGVKQPNAVIGTVLAADEDFERIDVNKFKYIGVPF
jgi:predicted RNase H-like nuclease (RuvC/YqgF family)